MISKLTLKDPSLLRDACLVAGEWVAADGGGTIAVDNPSTGAVIGHVPNMGTAETRRAIEFADAALPAWRARTGKERAILRRWFDLMMANQDDLGDDGGAGQAARGSQGRDRLCGKLHRMVRRGSKARLWRHDSKIHGRPAHRRIEAADRCLRHHHAMEFSGGDDYAQGRASAGGGV